MDEALIFHVYNSNTPVHHTLVMEWDDDAAVFQQGGPANPPVQRFHRVGLLYEFSVEMSAQDEYPIRIQRVVCQESPKAVDDCIVEEYVGHCKDPDLVS